MNVTQDELVEMVVVQNLPKNFFKQLDRWWTFAGAPEPPVYSERAITTFIRHEFSNYDGLVKMISLSPAQIAWLREWVNALALDKLKQWRRKYGAEQGWQEAQEGFEEGDAQ